ncbi:MAG: acetoacetate decarboxylase family protein [Desulfobacteraceae bacterium]|jgi:acetoacetate decarboxylase
MGFVKSFEQIAKTYRETADFYDAEMLTVVWETKPEIVERLLPPPLKPIARPIATAFVANYPETNFGVTYQEAALFLMAEFNSEPGSYCLSMPVTDDMAMVGGREIYGYPKKIGKIGLSREGKNVEGWAERGGVRFFELQATLTGKFNAEDAQDVFVEVLGAEANRVAVAYNFKHFPAPEGGGFDYNPRLIREEVEFRPSRMEIGEAEIILQPSDRDPWAEVEIVRVLGAIYTVGNNSMRKGSVVAEVDPMQFAPHAFLKWDL